MTSFGWKRKIGEKVSVDKSAAFSEDARDDEVDEPVDWIDMVKQPRMCLEDSVAKSKRLKHEGSLLAENERCWEAVKKWDAAIDLNPFDATLFEMKAQAYLWLCEDYPAVQAASQATRLEPTWWPAHQTLGRAHLSLGEVRTALLCFCRAAHLAPWQHADWSEDITWAQELLRRKAKMAAELEEAKRATVLTVRELDDTEEVDEEKNQVEAYWPRRAPPTDEQPAPLSQDSPHTGHYVLMRDKTS